MSLPLEDVLAGVAADLGVGAEGIDFANLAFFQGGEFPIENEFDVGFVALSSVTGELATLVGRWCPPFRSCLSASRRGSDLLD